MNRALVRSFLLGVFSSHFLLGIGLTVLILALTQLFPSLKIFDLTAGEAGFVAFVFTWVMIFVYKPRPDSPDEVG